MKIISRSRKYFSFATAIFFGFPLYTMAQKVQPSPQLLLRYQCTDSSITKSAQRELAPSNSSKPQKKSCSSLQVKVGLPMGWHINSQTPPDSFLVPTRMEASANGVHFLKPIFPVPELIFSEAMGEKLPLYSNGFEVQFPIDTQTSNIISNTRVTLHYQACNNSMCFPPKTVTAELLLASE